MTTFKSRGFLSQNARIFAKSAKLLLKEAEVQKAFETCQVHPFQISEASVNSMSAKSTKSRIRPNQITLSYVVTWKIRVTRT